VRATVDRVVVLGFEVRVELTNAATGGSFIAQITRGDAEALALREGDTVYVRATRIPPVSVNAKANGGDGSAGAGEEDVSPGMETAERGRRRRRRRGAQSATRRHKMTHLSKRTPRRSRQDSIRIISAST
jgi:hypothetical protein